MKNITKIIKPITKIGSIKKILTTSGYSKFSYNTDYLDSALFIYKKNGNQVKLFIDDFTEDIEITGDNNTDYIMNKIDDL